MISEVLASEASLLQSPPVNDSKREPPIEELALEMEDPFVEGGWRGWLNVFGAFLVLFSTFGYANAFGVYQSWYETHQFNNMTPSAIAWLGSIAVWLEFSTAVVSGPLFDKGYFRPVLAFGSVAFVFMLFMTSLCTEFWQALLCQGVGLGVSMGFTYLPAISVLAHYFRKRRSTVMGIGICGSSIGGIVFPILLNSTFRKIGFASGVRASAYLVLGTLLIANLILKPRPPKKITESDAYKRPSIRDLFFELRYTVAVLSAFLITTGSFFAIYYIQSFFQTAHFSPNLVFYSLAILNAGSTFGRVLPNMVSDKLGTLNLITICSACTGILTFAMFGATNSAGGIIFAILYGFFSGAFFSLLSPVFVALSTNVSEIGLRQGVAFIVSGVGALIGPPINGALVTAGGGDFKWAIVFSGSTVLLGSAGMGYARHLQSIEKGSWRV